MIDAESESTLHPLIYKANERSFPPEILWKKLIYMEKSIARIDKERSLNLLKELVPEWIPDSINK